VNLKLSIKELKKKIEERKNELNLDIFELLEEDTIKKREQILHQLYPLISEIDPLYEEDPNPILNKKYEAKAYLGPSKNVGKITFEDLTYRSLGPFTEKQLKEINEKCIAFTGIGASGQASIMLAARAGIGHFILADYDTFDPTNASRQLFCYSWTLGKKKTDVAKEFIESINSDAVVEVYSERITENNVDRICGDSDFIFDGLDNIEDRVVVSNFAREAGIPWLNSAAAGYEGRYVLFMPEDPPYQQVLGYSTPKYERGVHPIVPIILAGYKINDTLKLITGRMNVIRYPKMLTINMLRTNPIIIRDLRYVHR
jgi:adenylyltransferase/sulfurtransferase